MAEAKAARFVPHGRLGGKVWGKVGLLRVRCIGAVRPSASGLGGFMDEERESRPSDYYIEVL